MTSKTIAVFWLLQAAVFGQAQQEIRGGGICSDWAERISQPTPKRISNRSFAETILIRLLQDDRNKSCRSSIVYALAEIADGKNPRVVRALIAALPPIVTDENRQLSDDIMQAIVFLVSKGDQEAIRYVATVLDRDYWLVSRLLDNTTATDLDKLGDVKRFMIRLGRELEPIK